ncbi:trehalose-6-phosphate synthase [Desulfobacula sp.]|uniref:alpha,alpha-trehalose-phosphate synthase (UDP-forming) n=1 Tax=Desulfobacula sp. TaxID=2593537 RepID=UPI002615591E|nr:trehalose-6-phosphate synthase [Desulfobacula sp.]
MDKKNTKKSHIIIVSNRLPIILKKAENGKIEVEKGAGGLITAMAPILKNRNGIWIGWPGYVHEAGIDDNRFPAIQSAVSGYSVKSVMLSSDELKNYYEGFSNSILWPLFHGFTDKCIFLPEYWISYQEVNKKFALTVYQNTDDPDFIWVHDYQLILVGAQLRKFSKRTPIGFFLHIPFPPIDTFIRCPWRFELLSAMLEYDIIGFHTILSKRNFIGCIKKIIQDAQIDAKKAFDETVSEIRFNGRVIRTGVFPISIDYNEFSLHSWDKKVYKRSKKIRNNSPDTKILLGVDRLDYTKGIPEKLKAFKWFLTHFPRFHKKVHFIQLVVPSRREITAYADLKLKIEQLVGEINGIFSTNDWLPVQYMFRNLDRNELISLYRACDIAFITPLKDGMNLVAKEYCACNIDEKGVLILSEFAGAAQQFYQDAILVNPYDIEGTARAIYRAFNMPLEERNQRMRNLRENIKNKDIFWWLNSFLNAAIEKDLSSFPRVDEYFPDKPTANLGM